MSMTDKLLGMSEADKKDYADQEHTAHAAMFEEDEWDAADAEDFLDACEETSLDGLIVDTRDWLMINPNDIEEMNYPHCRQIVLTSAAGNLSYNRFISASNCRQRRGN